MSRHTFTGGPSGEPARMKARSTRATCETSSIIRVMFVSHRGSAGQPDQCGRVDTRVGEQHVVDTVLGEPERLGERIGHHPGESEVERTVSEVPHPHRLARQPHRQPTRPGEQVGGVGIEAVQVHHSQRRGEGCAWPLATAPDARTGDDSWPPFSPMSAAGTVLPGHDGLMRTQNEPEPLWQNWARTARANPRQIASPGTEEEVAQQVRTEAERGGQVRVAGAGHSFSPAVVSDGLLLRVDALNEVEWVGQPEPDGSRLVRVGAGMRLRDLCRALAAHGVALENMGDIDGQSIAGAISTGTHGTGATVRGLADQVQAVRLVTASGQVLEADAEREPGLFEVARLGLGSVGVLTAVTLRCVPAFTLTADERPRPLAAVLEALDDADGPVWGNDHFEFYWFPYTDIALTKANNRGGDAPRAEPGAPRAGGRDPRQLGVRADQPALHDRPPAHSRDELAGGAGPLRPPVHRELGRGLHQPAARAVPGAGIRDPRRGGGTGAARGGLLVAPHPGAGAVPDRGALRRTRSGVALDGVRSPDRVCGGASVPPDGVRPVLPGDGESCAPTTGARTGGRCTAGSAADLAPAYPQFEQVAQVRPCRRSRGAVCECVHRPRARPRSTALKETEQHVSSEVHTRPQRWEDRLAWPVLIAALASVPAVFLTLLGDLVSSWGVVGQCGGRTMVLMAEPVVLLAVSANKGAWLRQNWWWCCWRS